MTYKKKYISWLENEYFSENFKNELLLIKNNEKEIEDRFYKDLEFGTGGIRGVIGAGSNRINNYIIRKATQGLANYLLSGKAELPIKKDAFNLENSTVVIAYDTRKFSREFALEAALVLAANRIKSFLFKTVHTTPELSYAVRYFNSVAGIVITASHNPPEYNGYKIYSSDGCQFVPRLANLVSNEIEKIKNFQEIKYISEAEAKENNLLEFIEEPFDTHFTEMIKTHSQKELSNQDKKNLKIVYTPLHGTGARPIEKVLTTDGYTSFYIEETQKIADNNFSTVKSPNPEDKEAFDKSIILAKEKKADIILATDPDCDRVGVMIKVKRNSKKKEYKLLNGNQVGALLVDYVLSSTPKVNENMMVVNTVVTSSIGEDLAKKYGASSESTLTGFKYIGEKIKEYEQSNSYSFLMGYEESYGYLIGSDVRDKDGVVSAYVICEMAAYYKSFGKTLEDRLYEIFDLVGYYKENLVSIVKKGKSGLKDIDILMNYFRNKDLSEQLNKEIYKKIDYLNDETGLGKSNVIKFFIDESSWFAIRPSGTEPKIKIYFSVKTNSEEKTNTLLSELETKVLSIIDSV